MRDKLKNIFICWINKYSNKNIISLYVIENLER